MDHTQTACEYKEYFKKKFIFLFNELIDKFLELLEEHTEEKNNLIKIKEYEQKLNYEKILKKIEENKKLIDIINLLFKNNLEDDIYFTFFQNKEKYWTIMPSFHINLLLSKINDKKDHVEIFSKINDLYICSVTYGKVINQISHCENNGQEFNPYDTIGNVDSNIDIQSLFKGVEVKSISAYEMIMSQIINSETNSKMDEYMSNIKESDVNEAAAKLNDVLESEHCKGNPATNKLLSEILFKIKDEVINLKANDTNDKNSVDQLLGIAQKVASNMMTQIKDSDVSILDIWDATSSLAHNTIQSDALASVDMLIRSNIMSTINKNYNEEKKNDSNDNIDSIIDSNIDNNIDGNIDLKSSNISNNKKNKKSKKSKSNNRQKLD